ncbi:MAG: bifunctional GrpB family protein/GNAT family N-acetyltransferase [Alphaproteobacteria bacterium]|jgi:GrpB-like predicted nucleotidyltransferase (UPF0157 family)/N-acetylglutamate synthase-like GNAT family acetyltransferase
MKHIEVVQYNDDWPKMFEQEAASIKQALGNNCIEIHHVGSTSIPGLSAKPIIDIIAVTKVPENTIEPLKSLGFEYKGEYNIPMHFGFNKKEDTQVNLHVYEQGNPEIKLNILFRDYLRAHPEACQEYAELKNNLLSQKPSYEKNNRLVTGYNMGKDAFIRNILDKAGFNEIRMVRCAHYHDWEEYHRICEEQIFSPINVVYNRNHSNFNSENHYHYVLYKGTKIVSIAHIEFLNANEVAIRAFATDYPYKDHHYGSHMMEFLEKWIKYHGQNIIRVHARLSAEKFYRKLGYVEMDFNDLSLSKSFINLGKNL